MDMKSSTDWNEIIVNVEQPSCQVVAWVEYQVVLTKFFSFFVLLHIHIQYNFLTFLSIFEQKKLIIYEDIKLLNFVIS